ncbi:hypothetical protein BVX98_02955 [bacterium F11]|nr:hypothetical protein BVX98_02955 [bacterium F11]
MDNTIREVTRALKGDLVLGDPRSRVLRAACDSRSIKKGDLFFALKGENEDGHHYAPVAIREGAGGVVVSHLEWLKRQEEIQGAVIRVENPLESLKKLGGFIRSSFKGSVVGVTGSNGKTTTKEMIKSILNSLGSGLASQGNYNSQVGMPLVLSDVRKEHKWMVLEMGATEPGHIRNLCEIARPKVGVLTSIGPSHLQSFGSLDRIAESKWELMDALPMDGCAILPWGVPILDAHIRPFRKRIVYFGEDSSCAVRASMIDVGEKIRFRLHVGSQSKLVTLPISGRVNVMNALASAAVGWILNCSIDQIAHGLKSFQPPHMRMEVLSHQSGAVIINDAYNANPSSMLESVRTLVETYPHQPAVLVLGSMLELGKESEKWHFHVGSEIGRFEMEKIFLLGEEMESFLQGAISAGADKERLLRVKDVTELPDVLKPYLRKNRILFFKGSRNMGLERVIQELR